LLLSFAGLVAAFVVTGMAARAYHQRRSILAESWFEKGSSHLQDGRPALALTDLQTALTYARGDVPDDRLQLYELDFTEALAATNHLDEARSYLLDLWEREPGSGKINLALALLAARTGDDADAKRYFNEAINGLWAGDAEQVSRSRREARTQLFRYLAGRNETAAARSELVAMGAMLPSDAGAPLHRQVGELMTSAGMTQPALEQFAEALRLNPRDRAAAAEAGLASFSLGDDSAAVRYLEEASRDRRDGEEPALEPGTDSRIAPTLAIARAVLELDPYQPRLGTQERARRAAKAYETALARLEECAKEQGITLSRSTPKEKSAALPNGNLAGSLAGNAPANPAGGAVRGSDDPLAALYSRAIKMQSATNGPTGRATDRATSGATSRATSTEGFVRAVGIEPVMDVAFEIETAVTSRCGPPASPQDAALARIAQRPEMRARE
jgi:tetratricopeptide (TPR) repeat protein